MFPEGPNMILDDGGDATLYVLLGARAEAGEDMFLTPSEEAVIKGRSKSVWNNRRLVHENRDAIKGVKRQRVFTVCMNW